MNKSFLKARSIFHRRIRYRLETGFSMLEAVVVVGALLALAVGGFLSYGPIIENAKTASVKSAASQVLTAATVASFDGQSDTNPQDVISAWNASTDSIEVKILEPAGGVSENGDFCVEAKDLDNPSIFVRSGSCTDVVEGGGGDEIPLVRPVMVTTWDTSLTTDKTWNGPCTTITLPLSGNVDVTVDWGDGTAPVKYATDHPSHPYTDTPGAKTVRIEGTFNRWVGYPEDDGAYLPWSQDCITAVNTWEETGTTDVRAAFSDSVSIAHVSNVPKSATDWGDLFSFTSFNGDISGWDSSNVTNMEGMFFGNAAFNQDIGDWDTSKVTDMTMMFYDASGFNQNINSWDTSNVVSMRSMFVRANAFNQPLNNWNTSNVTNMSYMFRNNLGFNQDLSGWNVDKVTSTTWFSQGSALTPDHLPLGEKFVTQAA